MRALLLILLGLAFGLQRDAQADAEYRLHMPSAAEYLAAVPDALAAYQTELPDYYGKIPYQPMVDVISEELVFRYDDETLFDQRFDLLANARSAIDYSGAWASNRVSLKNDADWLVATFKAWLRDNPVDLTAAEELDLPGLDLTVYPAVDFDGDGTSEYWVDLYGFSYRNLSSG